MSEVPVPDVTQDYLAFRREVGAVWLPRDFLSVRGPDAVAFLQGQLSQDIDMALGGSTWALLLQPQGKMVAFLRVLREAEDGFVLETDAGFGPQMVDRLTRFKLRVKCDVEPRAWRCLAVRGPQAHALVDAGSGPPAGAAVVLADWPGLPGADLVGESPTPPPGVRLCSLDAYESVRIEAGIPVMGRELNESTIPAEAGIVDQSVSFTKGCYTGQELVARIDSRGGNVPRRLRGIVLGTNVLPPSGAAVTVDGKDVGRVTSVGESLDRRAPVALGYVRRSVAPPAEVTVAWEGGSAPATVETLPLVS
ncbi:MAG: folate-binding protein YgfZ [Acidimicrobiales bacterium]